MLARQSGIAEEGFAFLREVGQVVSAAALFAPEGSASDQSGYFGHVAQFDERKGRLAGRLPDDATEGVEGGFEAIAGSGNAAVFPGEFAKLRFGEAGREKRGTLRFGEAGREKRGTL